MFSNLNNHEILTKNSIKFIDLARWVSAFFVVAEHARHGLLVNFEGLNHNTIFMKLFYVLTGLGHSAVMVFFVISGFLVGGLTLLRTDRNKPKIADYFIKRTARIYTVLIPALVVGGVLDLIGRTYLNGDAIYTQARSLGIMILPVAPADRLGLLNFIDNLFLLQFNGALGSNGPLWSLAYEWWYYMIFGSVLIMLTGAKVARTCAVVALVAMVVFLPGELLLWGTIWLMGTGTALFAARFPFRPPVWLGLLVAAVTVPAPRLASQIFPALDFKLLIDATAGLGFCILLLSVCRADGPFARLGILNSKLANFSYSLYLVHFPFLIFIMGILGSVFGLKLLLQPELFGIGLFLLVFVVLILVGYVFASFTEERTGRVRRWMERRLS